MNIVLVIDNNATSLTEVCALLSSQWPHLTVLQADNGPQGLHLARDKKPDLILLEGKLDGLDSFQTAKVLRHLPETRDIPLIVLTHHDDPEDQIYAGLIATCNTSLTKPVSEDKLFNAISSVKETNTISQSVSY